MVFAAGLLMPSRTAAARLVCRFFECVLWNTSTFMSEDSSIGDVFHSRRAMLTSRPLLQFVAGAGYLAAATSGFILLGCC